MKSRTKISRGVLVTLMVSAALCAGLRCLVRTVRPAQWANDAELMALINESERLRPNDDRTREGLEREKVVLLGNAWSTERLASLQGVLGSRWRWEIVPTHATALERRYRLTHPAGELRQWPVVLAAITRLEKETGVAIESFDVAAQGRGGRRRLREVVLALRFTWKARDSPSGAAETVRAPGPAAAAPVRLHHLWRVVPAPGFAVTARRRGPFLLSHFIPVSIPPPIFPSCSA